MFSNLDQAIIKTIIYSDVFDYPLTLNEIGKWLVKLNLPARLDLSKRAGEIGIKNSKLINEKDGFHFLKGRGNIVAERIKREKYSQEKLKIAKKISNLFKLIPTIKLVGVTGTLAMQNGKREDDIDLFIITSSGLMWTTRLLSTLLIEITTMRRHPQETNINNKICLNMFVDENHFKITRRERDLFSAHEVLQMNLLWDRGNTYQKFLSANKWIKKYLPNAYKEITLAKSGKDTSDGGETTISTPPRWRNNRSIRIIETILKSFQLWYMRKRRTTEVIKDGIIRFHPHDSRGWVMCEYNKRLKKFDL